MMLNDVTLTLRDVQVIVAIACYLVAIHLFCMHGDDDDGY